MILNWILAIVGIASIWVILSNGWKIIGLMVQSVWGWIIFWSLWLAIWFWL